MSQRIAGKKDAAIRSLAWLKDPADGSWRLISAGLDAVLEEWDLQHLRSRSQIDSYGGAVWDMAVEPARDGGDAGQSLTAALSCTAEQQCALARCIAMHGASNDHLPGSESQLTGVPGPLPSLPQQLLLGAPLACCACASIRLSMPPSPQELFPLNDAHALPAVSADTPQHMAVACDDGALRLFTLEAGAAGLQYHRSLPRTEGRVLAVAWHPLARMVVAGTSVGHLHIWEVATSREVLRITAGEIAAGPAAHLRA